MKLWSVHNYVCPLLFPLFPCSSLGLFHGSIMNCYNVLPTRQVLQDLLQCMCFPWSMVLQEQTASHGSSVGLSPVRRTAAVWVSAQTAVCVFALVWSFLACRGAACFTMVFSIGYVEPVLAFEAPPLTSSALTLGVCRAVSTMFFTLLLQHSFKICYH